MSFLHPYRSSESRPLTRPVVCCSRNVMEMYLYQMACLSYGLKNFRAVDEGESPARSHDAGLDAPGIAAFAYVEIQ